VEKMNLLKKKLTILINTCDAYSDVWPFFFSALNEYWPHRKLKVVLNTEQKKPNLGTNVIVSNFTDSGSWGLRLRDSLQDIETEFVLSAYDDFILEHFIDEVELSEILLRMESDPDIAVVYLTKLGLKTKENTYLISERKKGNKYVLLDDKADYRLNSAPAIWRRKDLLDYTGVFDTPWAWEAFGTFRTIGDSKKFYCPGEKEEDIYKFNSKKGGAIYRGKWVQEVVVDKAEKYKLNTDFNIRGFSSDTIFEKRTLSWKINFILLGYKMVGFDVLKFIVSALKSKLIKALGFKRDL
jgi:hypothetical protein